MGLTRSLHLDVLDRFQQRHRPLAFAWAVLRKHSDDQGGQLAALIAYYGFVSLFPLLLVFVTALGFVLQGNSALRERIVKGALGQFPIVSDQLKLHSLPGSGLALAIGLLLSLLGGLGITSAIQYAFNRIWSVPSTRRPDFLMSRLRGLGTLAALAVLTIVAAVIGGSLGTAAHGASEVVAATVIALAFNMALFMALFKLLTAAELRWRQLVAGVVVGAVLWQLLQVLGGLYLSHELKRTGPLYGTFALVLGLLTWLYLGAQLTLIAAQVNVVLDRRLWPRTLLGQDMVDADIRGAEVTPSATQQAPSGAHPPPNTVQRP